MTKHAFVFAVPAAFLAACVTPAEQTFATVAPGNYRMDREHASLTWRVSHNGLSMYTARFTDFDATLDFDPANPAASSVSAVINALSVETDHPTKRESWNREIATDNRFLDGEDHPQIVFNSTGIEQTGEFTGLVTGDLTLLGITRPVTLEATYNGTGSFPWTGSRDLVGFSARGTLKRSDFGMNALIPIVGDEVEIIIEAEFLEAE